MNAGRRCDKRLNPGCFFLENHTLWFFSSPAVCCSFAETPFHFPPQRREHGMKTRHGSTSKSQSRFLSTVLCQLSQMSPHLAAALRHIYVHLAVVWCTHAFAQREPRKPLRPLASNEDIQLHLFTPRPPWTPSSSALQSLHNKNCRVRCSLNGTTLVPLDSESSLSQAFSMTTNQFIQRDAAVIWIMTWKQTKIKRVKREKRKNIPICMVS